MEIIISNDFVLDGDSSYHYEYTGDSGSDTLGHFLASNYAPQVTYWCFGANAVFDKYVSSVILEITKDIYEIESGKFVTIKCACAPLSSTTNKEENVILSSQSSRFDVVTPEVVLPATGNVFLDVTDVVKYASNNYNLPWGMYFIGGGDVGFASSVTILTPSFYISKISDGPIRIVKGTYWADGLPYVHNGSEWISSDVVYNHNGNTWIQVR